VEGVFAQLKRGEFQLSAEGFDTIHSAVDTIEALLSAPQEPHATHVANTIQRLAQLGGTARPEEVQTITAAPPGALPQPSSPDPQEFAPITIAPKSQKEEESPAVSAQSNSAPVPDDFLSRLLATFRLEANEHITTMAAGLLALEKAATREDQLPILENIFREAHSLKGAARAVDLMEVEMICQAVEGVFAQLKRGEFQLSAEGFDTIHSAVDTITTLLGAPQESHATQVADIIQRLAQLGQPTYREESPPLPPLVVEQIKQNEGPIEHEEKPPPAARIQRRSDSPTATSKLTAGDTIRVSTKKLDSLFLQAEEMLTAKLSINQHVADLQEMVALLADWKKEWTKVSAEVRKLQRLIENREDQATQSAACLQTAPTLVEFMYWNERQLSVLENRMHGLAKVVETDQQTIGLLVDNLLEDTKRVLMLPFSSLLEIFPKMVRDLSRALEKEVTLTIYGGEVEIDKRILEELKTPLIHLLRNSIDHGVETPETRVQYGKPACGTLTLAVSQVGGNSVEILIADDGSGIDATKVKQAAVKKGLLSAQAADTLDEQAAIDLIFRSEVSTSPIVTDVSGRGLGMAIVREKVETLGGQITVETRLHQGTTFRIVLPLTLATFRGVFVRVADSTFAVPTTHVERVVRIEPHQIITIEGKQAMLLDGKPIALASLDDILQLPRKKQLEAKDTTRIALVLGSADKYLACRVDEILNEQEVLFKQLGLYLAQIPNIAGATVLGSGQVVPMLDIPEVLKSAMTGTGSYEQSSGKDNTAEEMTKSVLLAEDSVTSRMLLKGILESAGYLVTTAVDGLDAFTRLQKATFDLVVSDVEMPRMNGFELTAKIRSNAQVSHLPVVLVTGLDSRADRERGIAVGADAYIVKTNFDQSNLLDIVQRLL
jgi:two-component system chemotaxis sensor kinase CheA